MWNILVVLNPSFNAKFFVNLYVGEGFFLNLENLFV